MRSLLPCFHQKSKTAGTNSKEAKHHHRDSGFSWGEHEQGAVTHASKLHAQGRICKYSTIHTASLVSSLNSPIVFCPFQPSMVTDKLFTSPNFCGFEYLEVLNVAEVSVFKQVHGVFAVMVSITDHSFPQHCHLSLPCTDSMCV